LWLEDQAVTRFLSTDDKPDGWRLEDILSEIQNDIVRRSSKIVEDSRPQARAVLNNNFQILNLLTEAIALATDSTRTLNSLGPSKASEGGPPRVGSA